MVWFVEWDVDQFVGGESERGCRRNGEGMNDESAWLRYCNLCIKNQIKLTVTIMVLVKI